MPPIPALFTLPIANSEGGNVTATQPAPSVYLLTFNHPPDNRITPGFCSAFMLALDAIEHRFPKGVVITTSAIAKFYSNGLDFESAMKINVFFENTLYPLWRRLLTYPMPTIALMNGHAFAAGLMTGMMHDYRFMNPHRGFLCLNELDFGAPLQPPMASIFRQKLPNPNTYRTMVLESKRFTPLEALKEGIVDGLGDIEEALSLIEEAKLTKRGYSGVYGRLKEEMWNETVAYLDLKDGGAETLKKRDAKRKMLGQDQNKRVEQLENQNGGKKIGPKL